MIFFFILCILFLTMLFFPIGIGFSSRKFKTNPLFINPSNVKDPRYFSSAFQKMFDDAWEKHDGSELLLLSQKEKVLEMDYVELLPNQICDSLVYAESKNFCPCGGISFQKEIYTKKNAKLVQIPMIRAIACKGQLIIGEETNIIRWADAEGLVKIYDKCNLGISTTSKVKLIIGSGCTFKRLYAPEILLAHKDIITEEGELEKAVPIIHSEQIFDIKYVDDTNVTKEGILPNTIISKYDLTVLRKFIIQGHISCQKDVKIHDHAVIHGNVFAEGNIFIGSHVRIFGVVFSQENIYIDDHVVIGQPGKIKSVVARGDIIFQHHCKVYGYIGTEGNGKIDPNKKSST